MSDETRDGGPAFPQVQDKVYESWCGMSLRDWFAGQALVALAGYLDGEFEEALGTQRAKEGVAECAARCYQIADAMLVDRERRR